VEPRSRAESAKTTCATNSSFGVEAMMADVR
jgi:hypothetical protein